jgi:hypothetical protein
VLDTAYGTLMEANMLGRYVATMAAQELCSSHDRDIIDAATLEGECVICMDQCCTRVTMDFVWTGLVNVTTIINDDLQQSAVVAYFCRSAPFLTFDLIIHQHQSNLQILLGSKHLEPPSKCIIYGSEGEIMSLKSQQSTGSKSLQ